MSTESLIESPSIPRAPFVIPADRREGRDPVCIVWVPVCRFAPTGMTTVHMHHGLAPSRPPP